MVYSNIYIFIYLFSYSCFCLFNCQQYIYTQVVVGCFGQWTHCPQFRRQVSQATLQVASPGPAVQQLADGTSGGFSVATASHQTPTVAGSLQIFEMKCHINTLPIQFVPSYPGLIKYLLGSSFVTKTLDCWGCKQPPWIRMGYGQAGCVCSTALLLISLFCVCCTPGSDRERGTWALQATRTRRNTCHKKEDGPGLRDPRSWNYIYLCLA